MLLQIEACVIQPVESVKAEVVGSNPTEGPNEKKNKIKLKL
jgi:hypothetical protein